MGIYASFFNILRSMNFKDPRWNQYLIEFHITRDYYACHDYLEQWWFELGNPKNHLLMAFIMLAVSCYHYRADNLKGARILLDKATPIFESNGNLIGNYGIDQQALFKSIDHLKSELCHYRPFVDINLVFLDETISDNLLEYANQHHLTLYAPSDLHNLHLIHKHKFKHR